MRPIVDYAGERSGVMQIQQEEGGEEFLTVKEARDYLGTTKAKMARLLKEGHLPVYDNPLDRRVKLIRRADLDRLKVPRPRVLPVEQPPGRPP